MTTSSVPDASTLILRRVPECRQCRGIAWRFDTHHDGQRTIKDAECRECRWIICDIEGAGRREWAAQWCERLIDTNPPVWLRRYPPWGYVWRWRTNRAR